MGNEQGRMLSPEELRAREISQMDSEMKKKLSGGGIKYNIKVVIKGDRNTGKTCLWRRLQGLSYQDAYIPTPEIQIATINWSYKVSDDVVKVEVWDVVDKAKPKKNKQFTSSGLKLSSGQVAGGDDEDDDDDQQNDQVSAAANVGPGNRLRTGSFAVNSLDANTVDVLRGAHAVIIMVDPTKKWTWDYAQREVPKIAAENIYTMVLANYRDMGEHRVVTEYEIREFCREQPGEMVKCLEASMLNGYGLKSVVSFFNIPFLYMQRQYIQQQLDRNMEEVRTAEEELKMITKEQGYDFYVKWLNQTAKDKKAKKISAPAPAPTSAPTAASASASAPAPAPAQVSPPTQRKQEPVAKQPPTQAPAQTPAPAYNPAPAPAPAPASAPTKQTSGFFSKLSSMMSGSKTDDKKGAQESSVTNPTAAALAEPLRRIENAEDFVPADEIDDNFFGAGGNSPPKQKSAPISKKPQLKQTPQKAKDPDYSDSDDDAPNPLVAKAEGESDDDDEAPNPLVSKGDDDDSEENSKPKAKAPPPKPKAVVAKTAPPKAVEPEKITKPAASTSAVTKPENSVAAAKKPAAIPPAMTKQSSKQSVKSSDSEEDAPKRPVVKSDNFYDDEDDDTPIPKPVVKKDEDSESEEEVPAKKPTAAKKAVVVKRDEGESEEETPVPRKTPTVKADDEEPAPKKSAELKNSGRTDKEELRGSGRREREREDRERDRDKDRDRNRDREDRDGRERRRRPEGERRERRSRPDGERSRRSKRTEGEEPKREEEKDENNEVFSSTQIVASPLRSPAPPSSLPSLHSLSPPSSSSSRPPSSTSSPPSSSSSSRPSSTAPPPPALADAFDFNPGSGRTDLDNFYDD